MSRERVSVNAGSLCVQGLHVCPTHWIDDFDYVAFFDNGSVKAR